jgi:hypothetical protein
MYPILIFPSLTLDSYQILPEPVSNDFDYYFEILPNQQIIVKNCQGVVIKTSDMSVYPNISVFPSTVIYSTYYSSALPNQIIVYFDKIYDSVSVCINTGLSGEQITDKYSNQLSLGGQAYTLTNLLDLGNDFLILQDGYSFDGNGYQLNGYSQLLSTTLTGAITIENMSCNQKNALPNQTHWFDYIDNGYNNDWSVGNPTPPYCVNGYNVTVTNNTPTTVITNDNYGQIIKVIYDSYNGQDYAITTVGKPNAITVNIVQITQSFGNPNEEAAIKSGNLIIRYQFLSKFAYPGYATVNDPSVDLGYDAETGIATITVVQSSKTFTIINNGRYYPCLC